MADTRSAAGEGSERSGEPKVPAQDQPAHELAKLIAESDAKGKGFWRRRKRKAAGTPDPTPAVEPVAPAAEVPPAKAEPPASEPEEKPVEPVAESDESVADVAEEETDSSEAAAEEVAEDAPAEDVAESESESVESEEEEKRPTVGVVYEPEESADGFPLEYGEIIIGLPKQPDGTKKPAEAAADTEQTPDAEADAEAAAVAEASAEDVPETELTLTETGDRG